MNAPLPPDIARYMAEAAQEFRDAMAEQYARDAMAASRSPEESGYEVEFTK